MLRDAMPTGQTQAQAAGVIVEEKFFNIRLGETGELLKQAIEEASGFELEELAAGMWMGKRQLSRWTYLHLTARAQAVEDGTTVELRVEHKHSPGAMGMYILFLIIACCLILPIVPIAMWSRKAMERQQRERLVLMHKLWTELGEVVGAPRRATGYREAPQRHYVPGTRQADEPKPRVADAGARIAEAAPPVAPDGFRVAQPPAADSDEDELAALDLEQAVAEQEAQGRGQARS